MKRDNVFPKHKALKQVKLYLLVPVPHASSWTGLYTVTVGIGGVSYKTMTTTKKAQQATTVLKKALQLCALCEKNDIS